MIPSYGKVQTLGGRVSMDGLVVNLEEKVDGSQFSFMTDGDVLYCRSKNVQIDVNAPGAQFLPAVQTAKVLFEQGDLTPGFIYRGEAFSKPKHNALAYARMPKGGIILFDIELPDGRLMDANLRQGEAVRLGLEVVPVLATVKWGDIDGGVRELLAKLLTYPSVLSTDDTESMIEGVVIKPVEDTFIIYGGQEMRLRAKFVNDDFKELNAKNWKNENKGPLETVMQAVRSEARWRKSVQAMRDDGTLTGSVKDIGPLITYINVDIDSERDAIADLLYKAFRKQVLREATRGFHEWYKLSLLDPETEAMLAESLTQIEQGVTMVPLDDLRDIEEVTQNAINDLVLRNLPEADAVEGNGDAEGRDDLSGVQVEAEPSDSGA